MRQFIRLLPLAAVAFSQSFQIPLDADDEPISPIANPLTTDAISLLGFGTWKLGNSTREAVSWAIQSGYRHFDCAAVYGNEREVGEGIRDGLAKTGLTRDDLWITSKLWQDHHEPKRVPLGLDESLEKLGLDYLNLYLMHFPLKLTSDGGFAIDYLDTWLAMEKLVDTGKTKHIGVANFSPHQMKTILKHSKSHPPQVHQMELHPYLQQSDWVKWHQNLGIHVTAYSPFAGTNPAYGDPDREGLPVPLLKNEVMQDIADERGCTTAQVALIWGIGRGTSVIPKATSEDHIKQNFHSLECILHEEDLDKIHKLGAVRYRYNNPNRASGVHLFEGLEDSLGEHKKHS